MDRKDVASWLEGPGRTRDADQPEFVRGERLGLPAEGPGRVAGVGARLGAFLIDTILCAAVAWTVARDPVWTTPIFAVEAFVLTALTGGSVGQLARGLRVVRVDRRPVGWARAGLRTALLVVLIPALIWDRDGRGLHDRLAGSVIIHTR
jgi:uncharacterized RDD family membrane protein YckC